MLLRFSVWSPALNHYSYDYQSRTFWCARLMASRLEDTIENGRATDQAKSIKRSAAS
jgi:hypothetical protein